MTQWSDVTVGDLVELEYGKSLPAHARESGAFSVFGSNGRVGVHSAAAVAGPGIIVGRKGSVGALAFSASDFWPIDTTYFVVRKQEVDWRFLFHLLSTLRLETLNSHSAVPGLNREDVYAIPVAIPEPNEQEAIAGVLDAALDRVTLEQEAVAAAHALKAATMNELFSHGLRGEAQRETEIGPIPASWAISPLVQLVEIWSGGTPRKAVAEYWNGSIPWVSGKDLKRPVLEDAIDHVTEKGVEAGSRLAPRGSVLLLVRGMGLAKDLPVAQIMRPMAFNQDVKALVSLGKVSGSFLRSAIHAGKQRLLSRIVPSAHGTMTLNLNDVESFLVPHPLDEQEAEAIVEVIDAVEAKIDLHVRKLAVLDDLFGSLLHKLIAGELRASDLNLSALQESGALG